MCTTSTTNTKSFISNFKASAKSLIALSIPIILTNIFQTAYQLTDTFWIGQLGASAVASVSISFPILFFLMSVGGGLVIAGSIIVSQHKGANNPDSINFTASQTLINILLISVVLSLIGYVLSPFLVSSMAVDYNVSVDAVNYLKISFIGLIFMFGYFSFQALLRGVGEVKIPMYIILGTVLLNLFLDPLFIFGFYIIPPMGVSGAAIATVITQFLSFISGLFFLFKGKSGIKLSISLFYFLDINFTKKFAPRLSATVCAHI